MVTLSVKGTSHRLHVEPDTYKTSFTRGEFT